MKKSDDWRTTSVFVRPETSFAPSTRRRTSTAPATTQHKKQSLLVDLHEAAGDAPAFRLQLFVD